MRSLLGADIQKIDHPLTKPNNNSLPLVMVVLSSNRGLCGGYNAGILRTVDEQLRQCREKNMKVELHVSGNKGIQHFNFIKEPMAATYTHINEKTTYPDVAVLADRYIHLYSQAEVSGLKMVFSRFVSTVVQRAEVVDLLPLKAVAPTKKPVMQAPRRVAGLDEYVFSPEPKQILDELLPEILRSKVYRCFINSVVSEQAARMIAMKAATDNGEQMIHALTRRYNRVRQSQITSELLDIVGGAEALNQ